jgi:hypothetical protein
MKDIFGIALTYNNTYLNVFDCQAKFLINGKELDEEKLTEKQREALEQLKNYVIYTENSGAINLSGIYSLSSFSFELLQKILSSTDEDELDEIIYQISKPTEKEILEKAVELVENLNDYELIKVRDTKILLCYDNCQGYHNRAYVTKINNKYYIVDDGYGHHHAWSKNGKVVASLGVEMNEIAKEEAIQKVKEFLELIVDKYDYTREELDSHDIENEKLYYCEKCKKYCIVEDIEEHEYDYHVDE